MEVLIEERKIEEIVEKAVRRVLAEHLFSLSRMGGGTGNTTRLAEVGGSFDFLLQEPDLYSKQDLWKKER